MKSTPTSEECYRILDLRQYGHGCGILPPGVRFIKKSLHLRMVLNFLYHGLLHSEKGLHGPLTGSPEIDRLVERGRTETDPAVRHRIYREIEQIMSRRAIMLPLFHEQTNRFSQPEVQNFDVSMSRETIPYEKLWLRKG